jgi:hypothetical protein
VNAALNTVYADDGRVRDFLADSLALWRVAGTVEAGETPTVIVIRTGDGAIVRVERPAREDMPFRWLVRSGDASTGSARPCASLLGLLNALRNAFGVERGGAVRIAPAPSAFPPLR